MHIILQTTNVQLSTSYPPDASFVAGLTIQPDIAKSFLSRHAWFTELEPEDQERLKNQCELIEVSKGECILSEGRRVDGWYAVLHGMVKLESAGDDNKVSTFLGVPQGEWFGEGSALKGELRRYSVFALRHSTLLKMPMREFVRLRKVSLTFNHYLVDHLNRRLGQAMSIIEAQRIGSPQQRVAMYLGSAFWGNTRHLSLTQEELGHLSGLSRQTVNKVLQVMQEQGWVSLEFAQIRVHNPQALAQLGRNHSLADITL